MVVTFIILGIITLICYQFMGAFIFVLEGILLIIFGVWLYMKKYRPIVDSVSCFTGAPGTGKTKLMTDSARVKYFIALRAYKIKKFFMRKRYKNILPPVLVSNYPIVIGKISRSDYLERLENAKNKLRSDLTLKNKTPEEIEKEVANVKVTNKMFSMKLTPDIILLQSKLPPKSVIAISEFGSLISNQDWDNLNVKINVDEWARFIRQYTHGGYLFVDDQSSDNIEVHIRRRIGKVYNMQSMFKIPFLKIGIARIRHMSISEDIKVIEKGQSEDMKNNTSWIPLFLWFKTYDTHAFSGRVKETPVADLKPYNDYKTNEIISIPYTKKESERVIPNILSED